MRSLGAAAATALLAVLLLGPGSAAAAKPDMVSTLEGDRFYLSAVQYLGAPGRVDSEVELTGDGAGGESMLVESSRRLDAGPGCESQGPRTAVCMPGRTPFLEVDVRLWGGDDRLTVNRSQLRFLVIGSRGDDVLEGGSGRGNRIDGGAGRDHLIAEGVGLYSGGRGADTIRSDERNATLLGGGGRDRISGGRGSDQIRGGNGADEVQGGGGSDDIAGGRGADLLRGGASGDAIRGGLGRDLTRGGRGDDSIWLARRDRDRRADCGPGRDKIELDRRRLDPEPRRCERVFRLR